MSSTRPADETVGAAAEDGPVEDGVGVDLYRTDDYVKVGRLSIVPFLRAVFEPVLGQSLGKAQFVLTFHPVTDRQELDGEPAVVNLRGSHGFLTVRVVRDGGLLYQHPHSVRELVARPLQLRLAEQYPEEKHWGFGIAGPGLERVKLVRPKPRVDGSTDLRVPAGRPQLFHLEKVPEPEPPEAGLADYGVSGDSDPRESEIRVVLAAPVHEALLGGMQLSTEVEEGGFLIGQVFRDRDRPGGHLVRITAALPAERTGASLLRFTFTGESFLRVNDAVSRSGADIRLIGWYHTHLFAATTKLGLSSIDVDLHTGTFLRRWHVAGLINLHAGKRNLRLYGWNGTEMSQLPSWVER